MPCSVSNLSHRTLKLHEWLALLALLFVCNGVRAATAYKCTNAAGDVAYQATTCAASQRSAAIVLAPAPPAASSPQYALDRMSTVSQRARVSHLARANAEMAYECRTSDGDVFYRLSHCPHSVAEKSDSHRGRNATHAGAVSSHPVTRAMACSEMRRAGAVGRKGHEYDESISTYDRNLGNDPCK